jgi:SAM-dependent methyltransferase
VEDNRNELLSEVASYYTTKLKQYGETAQGVDWKNEGSQLLRFDQLSKIVNDSGHFSINDLGCGYGSLCNFLANQFESFSYLGIDVSENMIQAAERKFHNLTQVRFVLSYKPDQVADYGIASGIFNVRLGRSDNEWRSYLEETLDILDRTSNLGFAFNCLTSYSDQDKMRDDLYYADPCALFDLCKRRYSQNVALLHDYGLYEFTILVRKKA